MKTCMIAALAVTAIALGGCSDGSEGGRTGEVIWRLDRAATIAHADAGQRDAVRRRLQGVDVVLRLRGSAYDLGINGLNASEKSSGTFARVSDGLSLHRRTVDGAAVSAGADSDVRLRSDAQHVYVFVGDVETVLSAK